MAGNLQLGVRTSSLQRRGGESYLPSKRETKLGQRLQLAESREQFAVGWGLNEGWTNKASQLRRTWKLRTKDEEATNKAWGKEQFEASYEGWGRTAQLEEWRNEWCCVCCELGTKNMQLGTKNKCCERNFKGLLRLTIQSINLNFEVKIKHPIALWGKSVFWIFSVQLIRQHF